MLTVDEAHLGTPEATWIASGRIPVVDPLPLGPWRRAVVVAPHPDDEVLGAGGLLQLLARRGLNIEVVAVTDGEASHPGSVAVTQGDLAKRRAEERTTALERLLPRPVVVTRLGLPDGGVEHFVRELSDHLASQLRPDDLCIAPWWRDGHPDHDVVGSVARTAAATARCDLLAFLIWTWHWARPDGQDIPWKDCQRVALTRRETARKRWATSAYLSQIRPVGAAPEDRVVLPGALLRRSWRSNEVFIVDPVTPT